MNAEVRPIKTSAEQALAAAYQHAKAGLPGGENIVRLREQAIEAFVESGLPHRRIEEWKYTDLRSILREAAPLAGPPDAAAVAQAQRSDPFAKVDARRVVLVNGHFVEELSDFDGLERGLTIIPLSRALAENHPQISRLGALQPAGHDPVFALNTAFLGGGVLLELAEGVRSERPIHIRQVFAGSAPAATFARVLAVIGPRAHATIVQSFAGPDGVAYQANSAFELHVGDRAEVAAVRLQAEGDRALHLATSLADIGREARFDSFALTSGAAVARHSVSLRFSGEQSVADVTGATLLRDRQHADTTLVVDHAVPGCSSRELFKSVLEGSSRAVVQGRIVVRPHAQETDARMMLAALLLGEEAEADHKPELEIYADNVQCGHGATAGALDEQLLFYLRARGIPEKEAQALLVQAFFGEAIDHVAHGGIRAALTERAVHWLGSREPRA